MENWERGEGRNVAKQPPKLYTHIQVCIHLNQGNAGGDYHALNQLPARDIQTSLGWDPCNSIQS